MGVRKISFYKRFQRALSTKGKEGAYAYAGSMLFEVLAKLISTGRGDRKAQEIIQAKLYHLKARQGLYENIALKQRVRTVLQELRTGRYHKFSDGWRSATKDLFIAIAPKCLNV